MTEKEKFLNENHVSLHFWVWSLRIRGQNWVWSNRKSNMAPNLEKSTKKSEIFFFVIVFRAKRLLGLDPMIDGDRNSWTTRNKIVSPISNSHSLRKMADIQYVGHAILETTRFSRNSVLRSFWGRWLWIWHRFFEIQNDGPNMVDIIFWKPNDFRGTFFSGAVEVADYKFDIEFPFFKMADPIWRTWNFETLRFSHNSVLGGFRARWLRISNLIFRIPYGNMVFVSKFLFFSHENEAWTYVKKL